MSLNNLGQISAIYKGTTAPVNTEILWYDITSGVFKYYNISTTTWDLLTQPSGINNERCGKITIIANTLVTVKFQINQIDYPYIDNKWQFRGEPYCLDIDGFKVFPIINNRTKNGFSVQNDNDRDITIEYSTIYTGI